MSEQLRHKMIDFEATPPPAAWKAIASRLDDNVQFDAVANKMNNFETAPPSDLWNAVALRLDDDTRYAAFATRMNHADTIPPNNAWDAIAARLDDDIQYAGIATKMNNFDAAPPPQIWNNIAASLQETKAVVSQAVPIRNIMYRIAAAAVIAGLFVGGWMLINKNKLQTELAKNNNLTAPVHPAPKQTGDSVTADNNPSDSATTAIAGKDQHQSGSDDTKKLRSSTAADIGAINNHPLKHAIINNIAAYSKAPIAINSSPILDKDGNVIRDMDVLTTSNYLIVTGPNGQSTRISSKFANVIRYLNSDDDEEYLDKVIKESDTWKKRFHEWRSKISQSSFIPSSANFLDIIEFKDLIQEKQ